MTETTGFPAAPPPLPPTTVAEAAPRSVEPNRLYQIAAWVAIVAGAVFIVAVIFFAGFTLGRHSGYGHFDRDYGREMGEFHHPIGPMGPPVGPMGPMGPGQFPGFGPGGGPGQPPQSTAPARP